MRRFLSIIVFLGMAWLLYAENTENPIIHKTFEKKFHIAATYTFPTLQEYNIKPCKTWNLRMMIPLPSTNEFHTVENLKTPHGEVKEFLEGENRYAAYSFSNVPASITVEYDVTIWNYFVDLAALKKFPDYDTRSTVYTSYTKKTTGQIDPDHPKIKQTADALWAESMDKLDYARKAYLYVGSNTTYITGSYNSIDEIYERGTGGKPAGDCGAHSILYVSMLRNKGIPARLQTGWVISNKNEWDSHMWTEFFVQGIGWVGSDPTFKSGDTFFSFTPSSHLFLNRGEPLTGVIGDWTFRWENGSQLKAYNLRYTGTSPTGTSDFYIKEKTIVTPLVIPDIAGFYNQKERVNAMIDDIVDRISVKLALNKIKKPVRSLELEKAANLKLGNDQMTLEAALKEGGFSANGIYLLHWKFSAIPGQNPVDNLMSILNEKDYINTLLHLENIGIGYQYKDDLHDFYMISANGKKSGKIEIILTQKSFKPVQSFNVEVKMKETIPDKLDWIGLYEADETPDGSPPSIWWDYLSNLKIGEGGIFTFNPSNIQSDKQSRYKAGKKYKWVIAYFDGYKIEAETGFDLK